jgi:hypothetical protein
MTDKHPKRPRDLKGPCGVCAIIPRRWLARHPRWTFHFIPTSASWLNAVKGFFAKLTRRRLKRGVFRSLVDLQVAINRFLAETNSTSKPFVWTADPKRVLAGQAREGSVRVNPLAKQKIGVKKIAKALKRTPGATGVKAAKFGVSLDTRG